MNILKPIRCFIRQWWWMLASAVIAFVLIVVLTLGLYWLAYSFDELWLGDSSASLFQGMSLHGLVLVVIATIGVPFALWRSLTLQKQSDTALKQSDTALRQSDIALAQMKIATTQAEIAVRQAEIAQSGLLDDRYQTGIELLGHAKLSVRLGGIYALEHVAGSDPLTYHIPTMSVLSAFIRNWHIEHEQEGKQDNTALDNEQKKLPEDVRTILEVIGRRSRKQHEIELERKYLVNLRGARLHGWAPGAPLFAPKPDFSNVDFLGADLSEVRLSLVKLVNSIFMYANLSGAMLVHADLSHASFVGADLSDGSLAHANLSGASFGQAKLSSTDLKRAEGLTQEQINSAKIDAQCPPVLEDAVDSNTKQPLIVPLQSH